MNKEYPSIKSVACVNGFLLKIIAIVTMLVDHIGAVLFPGQMVFRYIGRIAFPIFAFLIVEGFFNTRNVRRYELRLLIFALISEIPFDLAFNGTVLEFRSQNVFFTLFLGLVMIDLISLVREKISPYLGGIVLEIVILLGFIMLAFLMRTDYSGGGVLLIYCFYRFRDMHLIKYILFGLICLLFYTRIELYALLAVIPLLLYNGKRGFRQSGGLYSGKKGPASQLVKYLFYIFYPAHLLIIHFIAVSIR